MKNKASAAKRIKIEPVWLKYLVKKAENRSPIKPPPENSAPLHDIDLKNRENNELKTIRRKQRLPAFSKRRLALFFNTDKPPK